MYLDTRNKTECFGCEGCVQICAQSAIQMEEDEEGFRYPFIDSEKCINCGLCRKTCPYEHTPMKDSGSKYVYGGYSLDPKIRFESTSGGAFSAIVETFCDYDYAIFGAEAKGLTIEHGYITDILELGKFRKSKYLQSIIGSSYKRVKKFLNEGRKVLFSGTPCQIAGLNSFLQNYEYEKLLTVEVVCHGVPNQDFFDDYRKNLELKIGKIKEYTFRYKMKSENGMKWYSSYVTAKKRFVRNWPEDSFNYYYMKSLIYRDSCYSCRFASSKRQADVTLCDYWHWNDLHGNDFRHKSSVSGVVVNSQKGLRVIDEISSSLKMAESDFDYLASHNSCLIRPCGEKKDRKLLLEKWKKEGYAAIDRAFKRKYWIQILKYGILRLLPDGFLLSTHKVKKWMSK